VLESAFLVLLSVVGADPDTPINELPKSSPEQRLAFAKQAAESYHFRWGDRGDAEAKLCPDPLLRWNNQVIREDDGFLFLWTEGDKGRPVAAAQFFVAGKDWHHEFQSLSLHRFDGRCELNESRDWSWHPTSPGLEFVTSDTSDVPASSATQRLRQMKAIAERFTAAVDVNEAFDHPEQLRLLTTPIYRYSSASHSLEDGAVFAFVQGTNPEILVLIEAVTTDTNKTVANGFARMSSYNLRVLRDDRIVWKKDRAPVPQPDRISPYHFRLRAQIDASAEIKLPTIANEIK